MRSSSYLIAMLFIILLVSFTITNSAYAGSTVSKRIQTGKVCGLELCNTPMTAQEKIKQYLISKGLLQDTSVSQQSRFSIGGVTQQEAGQGQNEIEKFGDADADGDTDSIVVNANGKVTVSLNNGDSPPTFTDVSFNFKQDFDLPGVGTAASVSIDDGKIVIATTNGSTLAFTKDSAGNFVLDTDSSSITQEQLTQPQTLGDNTLVTTNQDGTITVTLSSGQSLTYPAGTTVSFEPATYPSGITVTDTNDLKVASETGGKTTIITSSGTQIISNTDGTYTITFSNGQSITYPAGTTISYDVSTITVTKSDGTIIKYDAASGSVLETTPNGPQEPTIALDPTSGLPGTLETVTGSNFPPSSLMTLSKCGMCSQESITVDSTGSFSFTYTAAWAPQDIVILIDNSWSNTISVSALFTIIDTTAPTITAPANIVVQATSSSGAIVTYQSPTVYDDDITAYPSCTPVSGSTFPVGTTTVTCTAIDSAGNTSSTTFTVTVEAVDPTTLPSLSIADATFTEGTQSGTNALLRVTSTLPAPTGGIQFTFTTNDGTATAPSDYVAVTGGSASILAGQTTVTILIPIFADSTLEPDETFTITISSKATTIADGSATVTIANDDQAASATTQPTLSIADVSVTEGNSGGSKAPLTITVNPASSSQITVNLATADGTAIATKDYNSQAKTITIPAGQASVTIGLEIIGDTIPELDETLTVTLSSPVGATILDGTAIVTIKNDEVPKITLDPTSGQAGTLVTIIGSDFLPSTKVTFTIGKMELPTKEVTTDSLGKFKGQVKIPSDVPKGDAKITAMTAKLYGSATFTVKTPSPILSISDITVYEGRIGSVIPTYAVLTVTSNLPAPTGGISVTYSTVDGTATGTGGSRDYMSVSGTATISPGQTSVTFQTQILADAIQEPDETFTVNISSASATISDGSVIVTIKNNIAQ